jgi:hypothetical protein
LTDACAYIMPRDQTDVQCIIILALYADRTYIELMDLRRLRTFVGEDAVMVIDRDFLQMLHQERFRRAAGECSRIAVHSHRGVLRRLLWATAEKLRELLSDYLTDYRRDLRMSELDRTEKRITLGDMWCRVLEDSDDKTGLILGRDRSVPSLCRMAPPFVPAVSAARGKVTIRRRIPV